MKRVAAIFVVTALGLLSAGCGGAQPVSTETSATPVAGQAAPGQPAPGAVAPAVAPEPKKTVPRAFEKKTSTPAFFIEALNKDQPILVLFYGEDEISQDVLTEARKLVDDKYYGGGAIFLLMKMDENDDIKKLERDFDLSYVPYTAVINRGEQIAFEKNGYIDSKILEQALYNAMNK